MLKIQIETIKSTVASPGKRMETSSIGGFTFHDMDNVDSWMVKFLPRDFPFGGFIDVYGLLASFVSKK